jgi:integrase
VPGLGTPGEHALIPLLALNGLRVSETTGADSEHLGMDRGHRTLTITRKGCKIVTIAFAPRTARAVGEQNDGPLFLAAEGRRLDRRGARRIVRLVALRAGILKTVTPQTLRHRVHHHQLLFGCRRTRRRPDGAQRLDISADCPPLRATARRARARRSYGRIMEAPQGKHLSWS